MVVHSQNANVQYQEYQNQRWSGIDILKVLCSFLVVIIHAPFPGVIGGYITAFARISVPIFFMITGFFYSNIRQQNKQKRQINKMFRLFMVANLLSLLAGCVSAIAAGKLPVFLASLTKLRTIADFWLWNEPPFGRHLWYLGAIFYTLILVYVAEKANILKWLTWLTPVLLAVSLVFGKYCILLLETQIPYVYVRNFCFLGLPYFLIGNWLFEHRQKIFQRFTTGWILVCLVAFTISTMAERYLLVINQVNASNDYYISTPFLACAVFIWFTKWNVNESTGFTSVLCKIGKQYSMWIYFIHPLLIGAVDWLLGDRLQVLRPVVTFLFALGLCALVIQLIGLLSKKKHHQ